MNSSGNDFGFVAPTPVGEDKQLDLFDQLLDGTNDDEQAHEATDEELGTLEDEFQKLSELKLKKERLEKIADAAKKEYTAMRDRMLGAMEGQGTKQFKGASGGAAIAVEQYTTTIQDEAAFLEWVREHHPELLSVNAQTRTKFIRENYRDRGVPEDSPEFPPGLTGGTLKTLQVRGVKLKE